MTDELASLDRRAVACKGWRWLRGMLRHDDYRYIGSGLWARWSDTAAVVTALHMFEQYPDLSDPATLGCLLTLVREAWKSPVAQVYPSLPDGHIWTCYINDEADDRLFRGRTEAEALVAALEAAPVAGGIR